MIMQEASMTGLRFIIGIVAFYYIFKFLARIFFPILVKKAVENASENFQRQQQQYQQYAQGNTWQNNTNNDEIIINTANAKNPRETKKVGEYVDYEEID